MQYYKVTVNVGHYSQTYFVSASPCLTKEDIKDYSEQLLVVDAGHDNHEFPEEEPRVKTEIIPLAMDEFFYETTPGACETSMVARTFGNLMDEIVHFYRKLKDGEQNREQYWAFFLKHNDLPSEISYVTKRDPQEEPMEQIEKDAYEDLMYQVRRYFTDFIGVSLHLSMLYVQQISKEEYENWIEMMDWARPW